MDIWTTPFCDKLKMRPSCESKFNGVYDYFFWCSAFVYQNLRQSSRLNKAVQCFLCAYKAPLFIMMHTAVMWLTWVRTWRRGWFVIIMPGDRSEASSSPVLLGCQWGIELGVFTYTLFGKWRETKSMRELDKQWIYSLSLWTKISRWSVGYDLRPRVHSA